jgi:hypothetical protein
VEKMLASEVKGIPNLDDKDGLQGVIGIEGLKYLYVHKACTAAAKCAESSV